MCTHAHKHTVNTVCSHAPSPVPLCSAGFGTQLLSLRSQDPNVSDKSFPWLFLPSYSFVRGGPRLEFLVTSPPQIQDDYLQKVQAKFGWMKKEGDTHMNLRIGLLFVKDLDQRSISMLSVNPTGHTRLGISCGLWLFPSGAEHLAEMVQGPFVSLLPLSVW